jgi:Asparagine synthase
MASHTDGLPCACGALGSYDAEVVARMVSALGGRLREAHRDRRSMLMLDREPLGWSGPGQRGIAWGEREPVDVKEVGGWREAATAGALGLVLDGERRAVHASASGVGPLYWRRDCNAVYFATAVDALAQGVPGDLTADWESVACVLSIGYPPGDGTLFAEIKRLDPLAVLEHREPGAPALVPGTLAWTEVEPDGSGDGAETTLGELRAEVARLDEGQPVLSTLTGGWDSRLLLCLLAERDLDVSAWTVDMDTGTEREAELAAPVARSLGVPHTHVEAGRPSFPRRLSETAHLTDYQTAPRYNVFLTYLSRALPPRGVVVDGFAAGFLKGNFNVRLLGTDSEWHKAPRELFDFYAPATAGLALLSATAWDATRETARTTFASQLGRFDGHPKAAALGIYWTRTRRRVGPAPVGIFGARHSVCMPFLGDGVIRASLRARPEAKLEGRLFDRLYELIDRSEIGRLPSTNDPKGHGLRTGSRPTSSPAARGFYTDLLARSPMLPWLSDDLRTGLARRKLGTRARRVWLLERMQNVCCLTLWHDRYAHRLRGLDPAELFGPRP